MSLSDLAKRLRNVSQAMTQNLAQAERETQREAQKLAVHLSSGGETARTLARAGHPYSRRAPNAAFDPAIINKGKTGLFADSWVMPTQIIAGRTIRTSVINISPEAAYMVGTDRMVPRLIGPEVMRRIEPERQKRIERAVDKTLENF